MSAGDALFLVGEPPKGMKNRTAILLVRKPRSKWWHLACFGQKSHYHRDGSCQHTDAVLASLNPARIAVERVRVQPFGSSPTTKEQSE